MRPTPILTQAFYKAGKLSSSIIPLLSILFFGTLLNAQPLSIQVVIPDPPPSYWEDYLDFEATVFVYVTNPTSTDYQVKLIPTITSDRGLSCTISESFNAANAINIPANTTVPLNYEDLRFSYGNIGQGDFELSGISWDDLYQSETLPEGNYTLCISAFDFVSSAPLSTQFGCDMFLIQQYEPPFIIRPYDGESFPATEPQFVNFLWSATGAGPDQRYRVTIFDLDQTYMNNPNDLFITPGLIPFYEEEDILSNSLIYDASKPSLIEGHEYAIQVTAYDPWGNYLYKQGGRSQIHTFTYTAPSIDLDPDFDITIADEPSDQNDPPGDLVNTGIVPMPLMSCSPAVLPDNTNLYQGNLGAGAQLQLGYFSMEIVNSDGQNPVSGSGRVYVDMWNSYFEVEFANVMVNTDMEVFGSESIMATDESDLIPQGLNTDFANPLSSGDISENTATQILNYAQANSSIIDPAASSDIGDYSLPVALVLNDISLMVTGMQFSAEGAQLNAIASIDFPEAQGDRKVLLGLKGLCFSEGAIGSESDLYLLGDQLFELSSGMDMELFGGADRTRLRWTAEGISDVVLDGAISFSNALVDAGGQGLEAMFQTEITAFNNWTTSVNLSTTSFEIPGLEGFSINIEQEEAIVYDHSDLLSAPGFSLPGAHPEHGDEELWKGLFIPSLNLSFPEGINASIELEDFVLDAGGVWLLAALNTTVLSLDEGDIDGWSFSIESFDLDVRSSSLHSGAIGGDIRLPIASNTLSYEAPLGADSDFSFSIDLEDALDVPMWWADLNLEGNSSIEISKDGDGDYNASANLHGDLSIDWEDGSGPEALSSFELPSIAFENLQISSNGMGVPAITGGYFDLDAADMNQSSFNNFPIVLNDDDADYPAIAFDTEAMSLDFNIGLKLSNIANGFDGRTAFSIKGDYDMSSRMFAFESLDLSKVSIEADMGVLQASGEIDLFQNDNIYGNGFDGKVAASIVPLDFDIDMRLISGRTNGAAGYRYFYFDTNVKLPAGVPLANTGLAFYGFGGGFYYNMLQEGQDIDLNADYPDLGDFPENYTEADYPAIGQNLMGVSYVPYNEMFGLKASVVLGLVGSERAMNGQMGFEIGLNDNFAIQMMQLSGEVFVMEDLDKSQGGSSLIHGTGLMTIDFNEPRFNLNANMEFNALGGLSQGSANLDMLFSPEEWHVHLGRWTEGVAPSEDENRIYMKNELNLGFLQVEKTFTSYFMMGNSAATPTGLPPLPLQVESLFADADYTLPQVAVPTIAGSEVLGFGFGLTSDLDVNLRALIFDFGLDFIYGLDVLLADYSELDCGDVDNFGINNWYALGSAYAYLGVDATIVGKLFGKRRSISLAYLEAASVLQIALPDPFWLKGDFRMNGSVLKGLIKFNSRIDMEFGEALECKEQMEQNIFDDIPIVSYVKPNENDGQVSIFSTPQVAFNYPKGKFSIEEEDPDNPDQTTTVEYAYEIVGYGIEYANEQTDGEWQTYTAEINAPSYGEDTYSCSLNLPERLPELSTIKFWIEVRGKRYNGASDSDVTYFPKKKSSYTFETGEAPDYILANSIDRAVPMGRQLYYPKDENTEGYFNFWFSQSPDLFRTEPEAKDDDLSPNGSFEYIARFRELKSKNWTDVPLETASIERVEFEIPTGFLKPESIYEIDIMRLYFPPSQSNDPTLDTTMVGLNLLSDDGPGDLTFYMMQQSNAGGQQQFTSMSNNAGQDCKNCLQVMGVGSVNNGSGPVSGNLTAIVPGEDPGFNPGFGFTNPGGDNAGLEQLDRSIRQNKLSGQEQETSLMGRKFYFRTSKYATYNQKLNQVSVRQTDYNIPNSFGFSNTERELIVGDELYQPAGDNVTSVDLPLVFLDSGEGMDRYETQYYTRKLQVSDMGQLFPSNPVERKYSPHLKVHMSNAWNDAFYSNQHLFKPPFQASDNTWCNITFNDPDVDLFDGSLNEYHAIPPQWSEIYQEASVVYFSDSKRHKADWPFKRPYKDLDNVAVNASSVHSEMLDFWQWGKLGNHKPSNATMMPFNTRITLADAAINAAKGGDTDPQIDLNDLTIDINTGQQNNPLINYGSFYVSSSLIGIINDNSNASAGHTGNAIDGQFQGNNYSIALLDITEWVTMSDYFLYRATIMDGLDELLDMSNCTEDYPAQNAYSCSALPLPTEPNFFEGTFDPSYNFYWRYYKPIRAYFSIDLHNDDYFPFMHREEGNVEFSIKDSGFGTNLPELNEY